MNVARARDCPRDAVDALPPSAMLRGMADDPIPLNPQAQAVYERRLRVVRKAVLGLASLVVLSLIVSVVFAVYNYTTDRPAKAMFGFDDGE
jgi:hypothetical protein